jgi:hypothetical protein
VTKLIIRCSFVNDESDKFLEMLPLVLSLDEGELLGTNLSFY